MKKHNLNVNLSSSSNDTRNAKALFATASFFSLEWIFEFGAIDHMAAHKNLFASISSCDTKHIFMGSSSPGCSWARFY